MTQSKREPFAKATKHPTLDTWLVADAAGNNLCWADDSQAWEQWDAESRANSINAAFNARVDEEVKKAVEEIEAVWSARLAQSEAFCVSLAEGGEMAKAILEDGFPIIHLRNFVDKEKVKAVEELEKWRRAAILLGERIGTVGPNGYYSFTADQFFEWVKGLPTEPKP